MTALTKQAAVSRVVAYIEHLTSKAPLGQKFAMQNTGHVLVSKLRETGNLQVALKCAYPRKTASERVVMAVRLIRGATKQAMGGMGMGGGMGGGTGGGLNAGAAAGRSAPSPQRGMGQTNHPSSRFSGSMFSMPAGVGRAPSGSTTQAAKRPSMGVSTGV